MQQMTMGVEDPQQQGWDRLYVSGIPKYFSEAELHQLFVPFGQVKEVTLHRRPDGASKGTAFISFNSFLEGLTAAQTLDNRVPQGCNKPISIKPSTNRQRDSTRGTSLERESLRN